MKGYLYNSEYLSQSSEWVFPLNFIDFETAAPAIPPYKGLSPYEIIAFQYSIHTLHSDSCIEHSGEFLLASKSIS